MEKLRVIKSQAVSEGFRKWVKSIFYTLHALQIIEFILDNNLPTPHDYRRRGDVCHLTWYSQDVHDHPGFPQRLEFTVIIYASSHMEVFRQWPDWTTKHWKGDTIPEEFLTGLDLFRDQ